MCGSEVVRVQWERARPGSRKTQPVASNTGNGVVGRRGRSCSAWEHWQRILGHPSWGLGCQSNLLTIPVSGVADSGLRSGFITRYGWSGQMTNKPGALRADEKARCVQAQICGTGQRQGTEPAACPKICGRQRAGKRTRLRESNRPSRSSPRLIRVNGRQRLRP